MVEENNIGFFAHLLNSVICRRPFLLVGGGNGQDLRVKLILSFVPSHRYLLLAGKIPRWARFLANQPRDVNNADLTDLETALKSTFEEEKLGRRPVQLIYFDVGLKEYEKVLKSFPMGWIATTKDANGLKDLLEQTGPVYEVPGPAGISAIHVGERPEKLDFEQGLLSRARDRHDAFATFVIQMKLTQLHLAGAAVLGEWDERAGAMTLVDLEDHFELDALAAEKLFELIHREQGIEIRKYFKLAGPDVIVAAEKLARMDHVAAVGVVKDGQAIWARRTTTTGVNIARLAMNLAGLFDKGFSQSGMGKLSYAWISSSERYHAAVVQRNDVTYVIVVNQEAKMALTLSEISEVLGG